MIKLTKFRKSSIISAGLLSTLLTCYACSADQAEDSTREAETSAPAEAMEADTQKITPKQQLGFSKQDLATRLGLETDAVKVSGATPVNWRSGALGCPKPGMMYTEALVPGIWIVLRVGIETYRYHAVPGGQPFYCPDERAEPPVLGPGAD